MPKKVAIVGSGQTNHTSRRKDVNIPELIKEAVDRALADAGLTINDIDAVVIGNMEHFEGINLSDMWASEGSGAVMKPGDLISGRADDQLLMDEARKMVELVKKGGIVAAFGSTGDQSPVYKAALHEWG